MKNINISINANLLEKLFAENQLSICDFKCLDSETKACVKSICLEHCINKKARRQKTASKKLKINESGTLFFKAAQ